MIEVRVQRLAFDKASNSPVVILKDPDSGRILPIWIGPGEANAIAMHMAGVAFQRPLTHDLLVTLLEGLGGTLQHVLITRVEESTYFAELIIRHDGDIISVDARPSDSIAIALRADARILAQEHLLRPMAALGGADEEKPTGDGSTSTMRGEALEERLRGMSPEDLGRFDH